MLSKVVLWTPDIALLLWVVSAVPCCCGSVLQTRPTARVLHGGDVGSRHTIAFGGGGGGRGERLLKFRKLP